MAPASSQLSRLTAQPGGDFVVFRIGLRINSYWKIHQWLPVARMMIPMLKELYSHPELGFLGAELHIGLRHIFHIQYWRSYEQLMAYSHSKDHAHLPAWREYNRRYRATNAVGIFHETYRVRAGEQESIYVNMPPYGLGLVTGVVEATGHRQSARGRMSLTDGQDSPVPAYGEIAPVEAR